MEMDSELLSLENLQHSPALLFFFFPPFLTRRPYDPNHALQDSRTSVSLNCHGGMEAICHGKIAGHIFMLSS